MNKHMLSTFDKIFWHEFDKIRNQSENVYIFSER